MVYNIEQFKSRIAKGLTKPNRYVVSIDAPGLITRDLTITCEAVELPGRQFATGEDKNRYGPIGRIPYLSVYTDLSLTFMCTHDMRERHFFDKWHENIVTEENSSTVINRINFFDNYAGTVTISVLSEKNKPQYKVICYEAYPYDIISQPLSYGENDSYLKLDVKLAYRYWKRTS